MLPIIALAAALLAGGYITSCHKPSHDADTEKLLKELDAAQEGHQQLVAARGEELRHLVKIVPGMTDSALYEAYSEMRRNYNSYDIDSAIYYAEQELRMADTIGSREQRAKARIVLARMIVLRGNNQDAIPLIREMEADTTFPDIRERYLKVMALIDERAGRNPKHWYARMLENLDSGSASWIYAKVSYLKFAGRPQEADVLLQQNARQLQVDDFNRAIYYNVQGDLYTAMGDTAKAINCLARSSLYDMSTGVRDYRSMYQLAELLLKVDDSERAYRYVNTAIQDAETAKELGNRLAINAMMTEIIGAHEKLLEGRRTRIIAFSIAALLMAVGMFMAFLYVLGHRNRLKRITASEKRLNTQLQASNEELQVVNARLEESNKVKDAYLVQYLELSSDFVHDIEQLKVGVSSAFRTKGMNGVEKFLAQIDDRTETKRFHQNFDSTFLGLFPDFVSKVNALMKPGCEMTLNRYGSMTTELRVVALIRLGINDSESIARFLRKSVTTIYNCRVKIRNNTTLDKEELMRELMKIT